MLTSSFLLLLCCTIATTNPILAQFISTTTSTAGNRDGWRDDYKLGYSYDTSSEIGPLNWNQVPSTIGWGEWEVVRLASAQAETNEYGLPLLNWDSSTATGNVCGIEARPSPIEILPSGECFDEEEIKVRRFDPSLDCRHPLEMDRRQGEDATSAWEITPYSLRYYYARTDRICRRPTVRLSNIDHVDKKNQQEHFVLQWLELHARSEHVVAGKRYDAELQMVHMATSRQNELAIVSVLIEASATEDHFDFQRFLLDGWQRKVMLESTQCNSGGGRKLTRTRPHLRGEQRRSNAGFTAVLQDYATTLNASFYEEYNEQEEEAVARSRNLQGGRCYPDMYGNGCQDQGIGPRKRLFPYNLWPSMWYYSYEGSITAPPCQGNVHWRIMDTPLTISRRQYKQLTNLLTQSRDERCRYDTVTNPQGENFRPLQNATLSTNDKRKEDDDYYNSGPQSVKHCTEANFHVAVYSEDDQ